MTGITQVLGNLRVSTGPRANARERWQL